jgi:hypothetical protein
MKKTILVGIAFYFIFIPSVFACANPTVFNIYGKAINPLGGFFTINGSNYPGLSIEYNFTIFNTNPTQGVMVTLVPHEGSKNYISGNSVYLNPSGSAVLPIKVWIGGLSGTGIIYVYFTCDDGSRQLWTPTMYAIVYGKGISPPPVSNCDTTGLNGCYSGLSTNFYCSDGELKSNAICTESCCKSFGGEDAMCSPDKKVCLSFSTIPPGTEGNIAFVCKDGKCKYNNERSMMFLLKLKGWNVTGKGYKNWTEDELNKYDIIACSDQSSACKMVFNSPIYNQHMDKGKPFLEITDRNSAKAANSFGYINRYGGKYEDNSELVVNEDYITEGFDETVNVLDGEEDSKVTGMEEKYFSTEEVKGLLELQNSKANLTTLFKVNNSQTHGRYAFFGWFSKSSIGDLTLDGEKILNNTLQWLKNGNSDPVYTKAGEIAFVCNKDSCNKKTEISLINWFRENGYGVTGKSLWNAEELEDFDLIACSDRKSCSFDASSPLFAAFQNGKGFLEFPDGYDVKAGYTFGYSSYRCSKQYSDTVNLTQDSITAGFGDSLKIFDKKKPLCGIRQSYLNDSKGISQSKDYNNIFRSTDEKRYAFIGWANYINELREEGKQLLLRTVRWVQCGNPDAC